MKWIIMKEREDTRNPLPFLIMNDEERAYDKADELTDANPAFLFWVHVCKEEGDKNED